jgi:hypothetical protein
MCRVCSRASSSPAHQSNSGINSARKFVHSTLGCPYLLDAIVSAARTQRMRLVRAHAHRSLPDSSCLCAALNAASQRRCPGPDTCTQSPAKTNISRAPTRPQPRKRAAPKVSPKANRLMTEHE